MHENHENPHVLPQTQQEFKAAKVTKRRAGLPHADDALEPSPTGRDETIVDQCSGHRTWLAFLTSFW